MHTEPASLRDAALAYGLRLAAPPRPVSERVWRLLADQGEFAFKLYGSDQRSRADKEATVLAHLQQAGAAPAAAYAGPRSPRQDTAAGYRVQTLVRTRDGAPLWQGSTGCGLMTLWDPGRYQRYDSYTATQWAALGASLAALHQRLDTLAVPGIETLHGRLRALDAEQLGEQWSADSRRDDAPMLREHADTCLRILDACLPRSLAGYPLDDPQRPIHNDYNQFNYLFGATLPPLILDWEAAIGAPREYELVRCLNHLPLESPDLARAFVSAYLRVRALRPERLAWAVDTACLQHALKRWLVERWLHDRARHAESLHGAHHMAALLLAGRTRLVAFYTDCLQA